MTRYGSGMADLVATWNSDAFRAELTGWVDVHLQTVRVRRLGVLRPVRVRFWSAVFQAPVDAGGRVWVKVGNPGQAFEGELLGALSTVASRSVVEPLAVNAERGWWLLPDGGPTLGEEGGPNMPATWTRLLEQVAHLQRDLAPHRETLSMVPGLPLGSVADEVALRLDQLAALGESDPQHLDADAAALARAGLPRLDAAMTVLEGLGIPDTLQPNDASLGNAVSATSPGDPYRLFDLGDAFWSHPFGVLHLPLRQAVGASLAGPRPTASETGRLAEAYLRCWPEVPQRCWPEALDAADRLGAVQRALSWERLLAHVDAGAVPSPPRLATWLCQAVAP